MQASVRSRLAFRTTCLGILNRKYGTSREIYFVSFPYPVIQELDDLMVAAVQSYFFSWSQSTTAAAQNAGLAVIDGIVELVDPESKSKSPLGIVISALTAGLALIPGPGSVIGNLLLSGLQQAPGVAEAIWPSDGTQDVSCCLETLFAMTATCVVVFH